MTKPESNSPLAAVPTDPVPPASTEPAGPTQTRVPAEFDPAALSGTANASFAQRLARQVIGCQAMPLDDGAAAARSDLANAAVGALKEMTPGGAAEAMLAAQMVAVHNTSLDLLQGATVEGRMGRISEERTRQYARLADVFLKQFDRYQRQRGRQRRIVRIEHVRVVEDGTVTVRQEEERVR